MKAIKEELLKLNLPKLEEKVLHYWRSKQILKKILKKGRKKFVFFEGPPFLNGRPHLGHFFTRAIKDVILRYKTMRGYFVQGRRAGWDTHGLPIEVEVEKFLGISSKKDVEKYGIERFVQECKKRISSYKALFETSAERTAYSVDLHNAYITCDNSYIESLWWIFKKIFQKKLLYEDYKIVPFCPRCGTSLSSHELALGYKKITEPSIYVKFQVSSFKPQVSSFKFQDSSFPATYSIDFQKAGSRQRRDKFYFLVWTTTPWTLPANVALAINPEFNYVLIETKNKEYLILVKERTNVLGEICRVVGEFKGKDLIGLKYKPLFQSLTSHYQVIPADFISSQEGTGIVHIAPAFGEEDLQAFRRQWPNESFPITVDEQGKMKTPGYKWNGMFVKHADRLIREELDNQGLLCKEELFEHDYPFCWRCNSPLLYYPKRAWFIKTTAIKKKLIRNNQKINWHPSYLKEGRFGEWLKEVKDWNLSRERYWGTPLPVWKCRKCAKLKIICSIQELSRESFYKNNFYLLRHGQGENNTLEIISNNFSLTSLGKEQIEGQIKKLKRLKVDIIYSSPIKRCVQTSEIISNNLGLAVVTDERLREIETGIFEGKKREDYLSFYKSVEERFCKKPQGGESLKDVRERVMNFIIEVNRKYQNKNILIVSHQDPLLMLEAGSYQVPIKEVWRMKPMRTGELRELSFKDSSYTPKGEIDLHRPYIDQVVLRCKCGGEMFRVKEVIDGWFDSGAMPFAQWHYPFENKTKIAKNEAFPADFICEGIDQTRGWFYTLLVISTLLGFSASYKNVVSLGLILDKKGQKMSKSKGNAVEPDEIISEFGSDVLRWYFYTVNLPEENKQFDKEELNNVYNKFFNPLLNGLKFLHFYGNIREIRNKFKGINEKSLNHLEKWMLSRLYQTIFMVNRYIDDFQIKQAASSIEDLISDFSTWYLRRSREKIFLSFLYYLLLNFSKLLAPFIPFTSEAIYLYLKDRNSVHIENYPEVSERKIDYKLLEQMRAIREITSKILFLRGEKGIKVRQPLSKIILPQKYKYLSHLMYLVLQETNIKRVEFKGEEFILDAEITQELYEEGLLREVSRLIQQLRKKLNLLPKDRIELMIDIKENFFLRKILERNEDFLKEKVGAVNIMWRKNDKFDAEFSKEINNIPIWVGIRKI